MWKTVDLMSARIKFVLRVVEGKETKSALCKEYGISRPTGDEWIKRYQESEKFSGLQDKSRKPKHSPTKTLPKLEKRVLGLRTKHGWGAKKIHILLRQEKVALPIPTINRILKRNGCINTIRSHQPALTRFEREVPNELWQVDFKGKLAVGHSSCLPLTMIDDNSRYLVGLHAVEGTSFEPTKECFIKTFSTFGVPDGLLMDHGTPWWSTSNGYGLSRLSVFFIEQGIKLHYGRYNHPQTQGKVERVNRTIGDAFVHHRNKVSLRTMKEWQSLLDTIRKEYNTLRPHEALGMQTPELHYKPSKRKLQTTPVPFSYPEKAQLREIDSWGNLKVNQKSYFVSESLAHKIVRIEQHNSSLLVSFRHMYVREINLSSGNTSPLITSISNLKV